MNTPQPPASSQPAETLGQLRTQATQRLQQAGSTSPALDASLLIEAATGHGRVAQILQANEPIPKAAHQALEELLIRREAGEPVAYILGEKEFWGMNFSVQPGVLIPRPDTETLIATLIALMPRPAPAASVAELGVGSGAILVSILKEFPAFTGIGTDISEAALATTQANATRHHVADRLSLSLGPWAEPLTEPVNIIVSNPPYIPTGELDSLMRDVRDYEPRLALDGGPDGLNAYRALMPSANEKILPGGLILLEIGHTQRDDVSQILTQNGWGNMKCFSDLAGRDRLVAAIKNK